MGLVGVDRFEAEDLGLLSPDDTLDGGQAIRDFNDGVEASARNLDPQTRSWVEAALGDLAQFIGDKSVLRAAPPSDNLSPQPNDPYEPRRRPITESDRALARSQFRRSQEALGTVGRGVAASEEASRSIEKLGVKPPPKPQQYHSDGSRSTTSN